MNNNSREATNESTREQLSEIWLPEINNPWYLEIVTTNSTAREPFISHVTVHHVLPSKNQSFVIIHTKPIYKIKLHSVDNNYFGISAALLNGLTTAVISIT